MADSFRTPRKRRMKDESMSLVVKRFRTYDGKEASDSSRACDDDGMDRWNAGLLYYSGMFATLSLMNTAKQTIREKAAHIEFDDLAGSGFALVKSKLYAFCQREGYSKLQFFVCDLSRIPAKREKRCKFKPTGCLLAPKSGPLVIPYAGGNKIFIIPTGVRYFGSSRNNFRLFCEVVHLRGKGKRKYVNRVLETPFDRLYDCISTVPFSEGFTVLGKYAYINLISRVWKKDRLVCLDMDAEVFKFCDDDPAAGSITTTELGVFMACPSIELEVEHDKACPSTLVTTEELEVFKACPSTELEVEHDKACRSNFAKAVYGLWEFGNFTCRDKLFMAKLTGPIGSGFELYVSSNLKTICNMEGSDKCLEWREHLGFEPLVDLNEFIKDHIKEDYGCLAQVWALPFEDADEEEEEEGNKFSMFIKYVTNSIRATIGRLLVCNFKLVDQSQTMHTDDAEADVAGKSSRYKCEILSHVFYHKCFPRLHSYMNAFTPVSNMMFHRYDVGGR